MMYFKIWPPRQAGKLPNFFFFFGKRVPDDTNEVSTLAKACKRFFLPIRTTHCFVCVRVCFCAAVLFCKTFTCKYELMIIQGVNKSSLSDPSPATCINQFRRNKFICEMNNLSYACVESSCVRVCIFQMDLFSVI